MDSFRKEQPYKRTDRVSDEIRKIVSEVLGRMSHHNFDQIAVTAVDISPDLRNAKIFYRLLDPSRRAEIMKALQSKGKQIQSEVGTQLSLRSTPRLRFQYDESIDYGDRMEKLFAKIHEDDVPEEE
ncbi:MAG: 30S ribosome-binding factor RbfA [Bdellovibrionota bacterium]